MIAGASDARRLTVGQVVASAEQAPLTRVEIAWYMVASYDLNPIHVDEPFARQAGFASVIGQGMLPLGFAARMLVERVGIERLRALRGDFVRPVFPGDALTVALTLAERHQNAEGVELRWAIEVTGPDGATRVRGSALTVHEE